MFHFNFFNNDASSKSSTAVVAQKYESDLIQILSLPLTHNSRQLEAPVFFSEEFYHGHIYGEGLNNQCFMGFAQDGCAYNNINAVCSKMNSDVASANNDATNHETLESLTSICQKQSCGEDADDLSKLLLDVKSGQENAFSDITPLTMHTQDSAVYVKASEITIPEEEQRKKGLYGLQFKAVKLVHPVTKRSRTKFICTFENCGKECENKWSFLDHNRHHTGFRPYVCNVCNKRFTQRGNLRQHKQIHKRV